MNFYGKFVKRPLDIVCAVPVAVAALPPPHAVSIIAAAIAAAATFVMLVFLMICNPPFFITLSRKTFLFFLHANRNLAYCSFNIISVLNNLVNYFRYFTKIFNTFTSLLFYILFFCVTLV